MTLEQVIQEAYHVLAERYGVGVATIALIIRDYDSMISSQIDIIYSLN